MSRSVADVLLTRVQEDARQHNQETVDEILRELDADVNAWPAADDQTNIASRAKLILDHLPEHLKYKASISETEPHAKSILQEEDEKVLNNITNLFLKLCK